VPLARGPCGSVRKRSPLTSSPHAHGRERTIGGPYGWGQIRCALPAKVGPDQLSTLNPVYQLTIRARREAHLTSEGISSSALQRWDSTIAAYWPDSSPQPERPYREAAEGTVPKMTDPIDCPNPTRTQVFGAEGQLTRFFNNVALHFHSARPLYPAFPDGPLLVEFCLRPPIEATRLSEEPSAVGSSS
jgi:hypothetical protein